jgi:hypothetical protein
MGNKGCWPWATRAAGQQLHLVAAHQPLADVIKGTPEKLQPRCYENTMSLTGPGRPLPHCAGACQSSINRLGLALVDLTRRHKRLDL